MHVKTQFENDLQAYNENLYGPVTTVLNDYSETEHNWFKIKYTVTQDSELIGEFYGTAGYIEGQLKVKAINALS